MLHRNVEAILRGDASLFSTAPIGSNRSGRPTDPSGSSEGPASPSLGPAPAVNASAAARRMTDWSNAGGGRVRADWHEQRPQPIGGRPRLLLIRPAVSLPVATKFKTPSDGHVCRQRDQGTDGPRCGCALTSFSFILRLTDKPSTTVVIRHGNYQIYIAPTSI